MPDESCSGWSMENAPLSLEYSLSELIGFLDYLSDKGLVNKNTILSRKAASNKMLAILDSGEAADLREIDLDQVATRFGHLKGKGYSPQSLQVYKSRVATALTDFFRYKENPANFKTGNSNGTKGLAGIKAKPKPTSKAISSRPQSVSRLDESRLPTSGAATVNFPVPLRTNCVVQINGLPVDLTRAEAAKISAVVNAMVSVLEE
jgi:site-specific recombinase XerD